MPPSHGDILQGHSLFSGIWLQPLEERAPCVLRCRKLRLPWTLEPLPQLQAKVEAGTIWGPSEALRPSPSQHPAPPPLLSEYVSHIC